MLWFNQACEKNRFVEPENVYLKIDSKNNLKIAIVVGKMFPKFSERKQMFDFINDFLNLFSILIFEGFKDIRAFSESWRLLYIVARDYIIFS